MGELEGRRKLSREVGVGDLLNFLAGTLIFRGVAARSQVGVEAIFRG